MSESVYLAANPVDLPRIVAHDLEDAFGRRGATVHHRGGRKRPELVVDVGEFCILVEVAKHGGADAANEYSAAVEHRERVETEFGKPAHLLFSCMRTPAQVVRQMSQDNRELMRAGREAKVLFLSLDMLEKALRHLGGTPDDLYPNRRWRDWFADWPAIANDITARERLCATVLAEDEELRWDLENEVSERARAEQEGLRGDVRKLEDALRHSGVTGPEAMRSLVTLMFIKLHEEKRELKGHPNRFTDDGFAAYRDTLPSPERDSGRTLHHLLEHEIKADAELGRMLASVSLSQRLTDRFVEQKIFPVLDQYHFRGTRLDALGAVFEAVARRAEKDTRIGQFFTPEPIVRFAVDVVKPRPTDVVLDPAAGTGRFLSVSMERMVARADDVPGVPREEVIRAIHQERLLGSDTDEWVVTIARLNMYIQGEGRSQIHVENGLFLADAPVFGGRPLLDAVDVCVTNPPLGAMSYQHYAADLLHRHPGRYADASAWLRERLPILPGEYAEDCQIREADAKIEQWTARARDAAATGDTRAEARARRFLAQARESRAQARERRAAGRGEYMVRGDSAKGGALFLAAIRDYLKRDRAPGSPPEWRGGKLGIIVDEAILNTPEYAETRRFIRRHYFVKAVFSFGRDAFWYQARTTAKTSLLYLVRKPDEHMGQREPTFYAHVERIGITRAGKRGESDLPRTLREYKEFERAVLGSYRGTRFDERAARVAMERANLGDSFVQWPDGAGASGGERMDYAAEAARQLSEGLPADFPVLGDFVTLEVRNPPEDPSRIYGFATIDRTTGEVRPARTERTEYTPADLRVIREGDVVVSGIDMVNGASGYAYAEVDGLVVSKEFYTLALRPERRGEVDPRFLAVLLQTPYVRGVVSGRVTGTSNRTRIEDVGALLALPLPPFPTLERQHEIVRDAERAREARQEARDSFTRALHAANDHCKAQCARPRDEATIEELAMAGD